MWRPLHHIIEDTRQQAGKHSCKHSWWHERGIEVVRCKLPFGDYALVPPAAVDTKKDILELCSDIDQQHERFRNELIAARDAGCKLFVLVENTDGIESVGDLQRWTNPRAIHNAMAGKHAPMTGTRLMKACLTMEERYGVRFEFCAPDEAAYRVLELLGAPMGCFKD